MRGPRAEFAVLQRVGVRKLPAGVAHTEATDTHAAEMRLTYGYRRSAPRRAGPSYRRRPRAS